MHITLEADYAVRIVHCLAKNGQRMDAKSISAETSLRRIFREKRSVTPVSSEMLLASIR